MKCRPCFTTVALLMSSAALLLAQSLGCQTSSPNAPASEPSPAESSPDESSPDEPSEAQPTDAEEVPQTRASRCAQSAGCTQSGRCGVNEDGRCAATEEAHCLESEDCAESGFCSLDERDDGCTIASDADCARSERCLVDGQCTHHEVFGCEATTAAHCEASTRCQEQGRCSLEPAAQDDAPLEQARQCFSQVSVAVEHVRKEVWDAYAEASLIPLRAGLERVQQGQAEVEIYRWNEVTYAPASAWGEVEREYVIATFLTPEARASYHVTCPAFLATTRQVLSPKTWTWEGFEVQVDQYRLRAGEQFRIDEGEAFCNANTGTYHPDTLLSWVGPVLTLYREEEVPETYRTYVYKSWASYDVRTGERAAVDALVEEASVVEAFKKDPWVAEYLAAFLQNAERRQERGDAEDAVAEARAWLARFEAADSMAEVGAMFNERLKGSVYGELDLANAPHSFAAFDEERGLVAMRLAVSRIADAIITDFITLGLWVKPRAEYMGAFRRAKEEGWLLNDQRVVEGFDVSQDEVE